MPNTYCKDSLIVIIMFGSYSIISKRGDINDSNRKFIKNLFEAIGKIKSGDSSATASLVTNIQGYTSLLEGHISELPAT